MFRNTPPNHPGDRFGHLVLVEKSEEPYKWLVQCDCGTRKVIWQKNLRSGATKSCGKCRTSDHRVTHGLSHTLIYNVWNQMRSRCQNPNDCSFRYGGGRGIEVFPKWDRDFMSFYEWAMQAGYEKGRSLERIRKDGNFEPANCQWSPRLAHNRNVKGLKLDIDKARAIRASRIAGTSVRDLSAQYNVTTWHIYSILRGAKWKDA